MANLTNFPYGIRTSRVVITGEGAIGGMVVNTPTLSPAIVNANTTAEQIFAVSGVAATDVVLTVNKPTAQAGLGIVGWRVSSAGNVAITFSNNTASGITPTASQVYKIVTMTP